MNCLTTIQERLVVQRAKLEQAQQAILRVRNSNHLYTEASKSGLEAEQKGRISVLLEEVSWLQEAEKDLLRQQQVPGHNNFEYAPIVAIPGGLDK